MITLNLTALLLAAVMLASLCKKRWLKAIVSAIFGIFTCMQLVSLYVGGSFCDYKFFQHFNFRDFWWGVTTAFTLEVWLLPVLLAGITAGIFYLSAYLFMLPKFISSIYLYIRQLLTKIRFLLPFAKHALLVLALLILVTTKNGVVDNLRRVHILYAAPESDSFDEIYKSLIKAAKNTSDSVYFTKKEDLKVSAEGKNIIIISLESFNRAFFLDKNQRLVPNLRRLKQQWNFYPMSEHWGSSWTVGSLYTTLTGLPSFFIGHGNSFFESTKSSRLISLIDVLGKAGYETHFLSNDAEFAGTKDLLKTFGAHHVWDKTLNGKYQENMKDAELFAEAKNILQDSARTKPIMIYISTLATHNPGNPDSRLFSTLGQKKTDLETAAYQTDWLVGDFVDFLKQQNFLKNTIVYIFPDHMYMGRASILKADKELQLWFLTNAASKDLTIDAKNFYQVDLPRNILSGAKVKHNATFLGDFIKKNKSDFIDENINALSALNAANIDREKTLDNHFEVILREENVICLAGKDTLFIEPLASFKQTDQFIFLTPELKIQKIEQHSGASFDSIYYNYRGLYIQIGVDNLLNVAWKRGENDMQETLPETSHLKMNHAAIKRTLAAIPSSSYVPVRKSKIAPTDSVLLDYLHTTLQNPFRIIVVSCFDDASIHFAKLSPILHEAGLKESLTGCFRCSYVAVFSNHKVYFEKNGGQSAIHKALNISDIRFLISSGGFDVATCEISINDLSLSSYRRGLNFVIFNTNTNRVEDAFNVDFFGDETLKINRF